MEKICRGYCQLIHSHSKISPFCTQLTTITPELVVQEGVNFEEALQILKKGYQAYQYTWASYGNYDKKKWESNTLLSLIAQNGEKEKKN
ncbi:hypothetical protein LDK11_01470 [Fusobacterium nucleatum]